MPLALSNWTCVAISALAHLVLIAYGEWHDRHIIPKYTDVDYRVFSDGVKALWEGPRAQGWLTEALGFDIGDPYSRATYRYTPLLAVVFAPNHLFSLFGKLLIAVASLGVSALLPSIAPPTASHLLWSLNPFVININTRGSAESLLCALVLAALVLVKRGHERSAALAWGLAVHWKIYPIIYGASVLALLHKRDGGRLLTWRKLRFGLISGGTFAGLGMLCWSIWGQPFLDETYLYHLRRLDHRHNFSPYFYPIYLSLFSSKTASSWSTITRVADHPLAAFVPQMSLASGAGLLLTNTTSIEFAWFVQTWLFVLFNKVCTSQYFMWWLFLLPPVVPHLRLGIHRAVILGVVWVASQAVWLALAYQLELKAVNVFLPLWAAGIGYVAANTWILVQLLRAYDHSLVAGARSPRPRSSKSEAPGRLGRTEAEDQAPVNAETASAGPPRLARERGHSAPQVAESRALPLPFSPTSTSPAGQASLSQALDEAIAGKKWRHASKLAD